MCPQMRQYDEVLLGQLPWGLEITTGLSKSLLPRGLWAAEAGQKGHGGCNGYRNLKAFFMLSTYVTCPVLCWSYSTITCWWFATLAGGLRFFMIFLRFVSNSGIWEDFLGVWPMIPGFGSKFWMSGWISGDGGFQIFRDLGPKMAVFLWHTSNLSFRGPVKMPKENDILGKESCLVDAFGTGCWISGSKLSHSANDL